MSDCINIHRNALSFDMMNEMLANIREDKLNKNLRCIVLSANGPVFSAGHNLKEFTAESGQDFRKSDGINARNSSKCSAGDIKG